MGAAAGEFLASGDLSRSISWPDDSWSLTPFALQKPAVAKWHPARREYRCGNWFCVLRWKWDRQGLGSSVLHHTFENVALMSTYPESWHAKYHVSFDLLTEIHMLHLSLLQPALFFSASVSDFLHFSNLDLNGTAFSYGFYVLRGDVLWSDVLPEDSLNACSTTSRRCIASWSLEASAGSEMTRPVSEWWISHCDCWTLGAKIVSEVTLVLKLWWFKLLLLLLFWQNPTALLQEMPVIQGKN